MTQNTGNKEKSRASMIIDGEIEPTTPQEMRLLNLRKRKTFDTWDKDAHHDASVKGGKAVAELYGEKKTAKQALENVLSLRITDTMLDDSGVNEELIARLKRSNPNATIYDLLHAVAVDKALKGSMRALEYVRDTNGDKPIDRANIDVNGIMTDSDRALLETIGRRLTDGETVEIVKDLQRDV